ncbi:transglutaminase family protein [Patescibacteria group bacterium]
MIKKLFWVIFLSLVLIFSTHQTALAQSEFSTDYQIDYLITSTGVTHTKFNISLTNNLSNIYAREFSLSIGSINLENIHVYNSTGDLEPTIATGNKTTSITIPFNDKVLGKDKAQTFTLEFDSLDFANQLGSIWEISIPKLQKTDNLNNYNLTLSIPKTFGNPSTFLPKPTSSSSSGSHTIYRFSPNDLLTSGISATFGETQYFDFSLTYHLENPNVYKVTTDIALPPDTAFQKVLYQSIEPKPTDVKLDPDGNWLASYILSPKESITVLTTGSAEINLHQRPDFPLQPLDENINYLSSQQYWEADNPNIKKLANELNNPFNIYQYIVDNLIYDYGRLSDTTTRFGAANALDNKESAICMEFTDLFVALSRAANNPARAVNGYAYTTNSALRPLSLKKDVLHAWPEYYDQTKQLWTPIDPTWGNTTGGVDFFHQTDLNHFTFAILGQDSTYPIPAGAYKTNQNQTKDVEVNFGKPTESNQNTSLEINLPETSVAGVDLNGQILVKNTGNTAIYNHLIALKSDNLELDQTEWIITSLPPFAQRIIEFQIPATSWNSNFTNTFTAHDQFTTTTHQLTLLPAHHYLLNNKNFIISTSILIAALIAFIILKLIVKNKKSS